MSLNKQRTRNCLLALAFILPLLFNLPAAGTERLDPETTPPTMAEMEFALTGAASGWLRYGGSLFRTESGGETWQEVSPTLNEEERLEDAAFVDANRAVALLRSGNDADWQIRLLKTSDGGASWQAQALSFTEPEQEFWSLPLARASITWQGESYGWVLLKQATSRNFSLGVLLRTRDGGQTWAVLEPPAAEEFTFLDENLGYMRDHADAAGLYETRDGGSAWQKAQIPLKASGGESLRRLGLPLRWREAEMLLPAWFQTSEAEQELAFLSSQQDAQLLAEESTWALADVAVQPRTWQAAQGGDLAFDALSSLDGENLWLSVSGGTCRQDVSAGEAEMPSSTTTCQRRQLLLSSADGGASWESVPLPAEIQTEMLTTFTEGADSGLPEGGPSLTSQEWVRIHQGQGFDACEIPTLAELQAWMNSSPYKVVNLYIGGISRYCSNNALTASYVQAMSNQGWRFIPTWVGLQAPCTSFRYPFSWDPDQAYAQGVDNANKARARLMELGLTNADGSGTVVYADLEYFPYSASCSAAARAYVQGWTTRLQQLGIVSGLYATSRCLDVNKIYNLQPPPDAVWIAEWYQTPGYRPNVTVWDVDWLGDQYWNQHQRILQYSGDHNETWGGVTINIDNDVIDGLVAVPNMEDQTPPVTTYSAAGTVGISPWYKTPVTVTLTASDTGTGVKNTYYRINSGAWQVYTAPFSVSGSGQKTIEYRSVDYKDNWEAVKSASFYVDTTPPVNPQVTNAGCEAINGVPQAKCQDPLFTWGGAYDSGVGLNPSNTYEYYWGTDKQATSGTLTAGNQFNPPAVEPGVPYYLRIRSQDKHGNWSAWQTIFTLIYDQRFTHQIWLIRVYK